MMKLKDDRAGIERRVELVQALSEKYSHNGALVNKVCEIAKVSRMTVYRDLKYCNKFDGNNRNSL